MERKNKSSFEERYTYEYSNEYYARHKKGFLKRISNVLEQHMAAKALKLAGSPKSVLDLPCGAGRFFQTILNSGCEKLLAGDRSLGMLQVIQEQLPAALLDKISLLELDATHMNLPDDSVDSILCMRLLHHFHDPKDRLVIYKEMQRVARHTVCISNWVEGNYKSYREQRLAQQKNEASRCLNPALLEKEYVSAGFKVLGKVDMLPGILYWRTYVLGV